MTNGFSKVKLRGVLEERSGITWGAEQESQTPQPDALPVLTVTNVQETLQTEPILYIRGVTERDRERKAAKQGWTIAVGSNGNRARIGNCVFIERDTEYLFASFLVGFRPNSDSGIDPEYFYRWMSSYEVQARLSASAEGTTGLGNLSSRYFRNLWIDYPTDPKEQRRITNALRLVDFAIAAARESIAKAGRLRKGLMQQLLNGRLKPDGTLRNEADFHSDDRLGLFPKGWKVRKLRQVVRLRNGKSNITSNLRAEADTTFCYPVFGGNGMTGWSDRYLLDSPTVVLGRVGEYCGVVHRTPAKAWVTDNALYASEFPEPIDLGFLFYLLSHLQLNRWKAITGQPKITQGEILNIRVAIPNHTDEQAEIAAKVDCVQQLIVAKEQKIAALQRFKKSLMQNLLTGRIRLPVNRAARG
jgi:type I restriction enzyme S subunit